jgi:putative oxygen-independent coproporphyrinogen III oxidase
VADLSRISAGPVRDIGPDALFARLGAELRDGGQRDIMVYVHVPFCSSKCHFCDFVADVDVPDLVAAGDRRRRYVDALCRQISDYAPRLAALGYRVKLVYWGGGTPSRLSADELGRITATLSSGLDLSGVVEHSFESSPETLTAEKVAQLRDGGVNRVSIGVQSFVDAELRRAGRSHSADQALTAARAVRNGGIENFNLDLIAAMPGQSAADLEFSLQTCLSLNPAHVTIYPYRADARTVMSRQVARGDRPPQEFAHMYESLERARRALVAAGYHEYAIGHFARTLDHRFRGESHYFDLGGDYIGFGAGASSKIAHHALYNPHGVLRRYEEDPLPVFSCSRFTPEDSSTMASALRLAMLAWHGIGRQRFERLAGYPLAALRDQPSFRDYLDYYQSCGGQYIEDDEGIRLTPATQRHTYVRSLIRLHRREIKKTQVTIG